LKQINTIRIRIWHRCDRCGQEEQKSQMIERALNPPITYDEERERITAEVLYSVEKERERITAEVLYSVENDPLVPDEQADTIIVEKRK
jgi:hypothetical protein